jgi:hypothetical protein
MIILFCSFAFFALNSPDKTAKLPSSGLKTETEDIVAPSADELDHARKGFAAAKQLLSRPKSKVMQASLFASDKVQKTKDTRMQLELIVIGDRHSFAMINNQLVENGDLLPNGYKVQEIRPSWVQLQKDNLSQRLDWKDAHPCKLN